MGTNQLTPFGLELHLRCLSDTFYERGTTRCRSSPVVPENKNSLLMMLSDLSKLLALFLLADSAYVSLSWALPQAFAS
jgi:hypothetical protein